MPTFADSGGRVIGATDPHGRILGFLNRLLMHILIEDFLIYIFLQYGSKQQGFLFSNRLIDCGKVVSLTHQPRFTPQKHYYFNASGIHFC
jgi:hypothetical protein